MVTIGATVMSDTYVAGRLRDCVNVSNRLFCDGAHHPKTTEIPVFRAADAVWCEPRGAHGSCRWSNPHEDAYFIVMLAIVGVAGIQWRTP